MSGYLPCVIWCESSYELAAPGDAPIYASPGPIRLACCHPAKSASLTRKNPETTGVLLVFHEAWMEPVPQTEFTPDETQSGLNLPPSSSTRGLRGPVRGRVDLLDIDSRRVDIETAARRAFLAIAGLLEADLWATRVLFPMVSGSRAFRDVRPKPAIASLQPETGAPPINEANPLTGRLSRSRSVPLRQGVPPGRRAPVRKKKPPAAPGSGQKPGLPAWIGRLNAWSANGDGWLDHNRGSHRNRIPPGRTRIHTIGSEISVLRNNIVSNPQLGMIHIPSIITKVFPQRVRPPRILPDGNP